MRPGMEGPNRSDLDDAERPNFEGHEGRECGEHRTVGPHRAWCFDCQEWCYPEGPCANCELSVLRKLLAERDAENARLRAAVEKRDDLLYVAWGVIANAGGWHPGDTGASLGWLDAAKRWRDEWHETLPSALAGTPKE